MANINYKQLYLTMKEQEKVLLLKLNPQPDELKANELPPNFNQIGWELTLEKVLELATKLEELQQVKGKRLTPPFYKTIINRAIIGINEANKLMEKLILEDSELDFEQEVQKLTVELVKLQQEVDGQQKLDLQE